MTKDGPDFPDRLLVAGRFDGYAISIRRFFAVYGVRKRWIAFLIDGFELLKKYMHQYCKLKILCLAIVLLPLLTNIVRKNNQPKKTDMLYIDICFHFQITQYGLTLPSFFKEKKSFNKSPLPIIEALPKIVFSNAGS